MTLASKFGIDPPREPQPSPFVTDYRRVGIEIEQEYEKERVFERVMNSDARKKEISKYWDVKGDGSLRQFGAEFVSKILYPSDVKEALTNVMPLVAEGRFSWRAGIHVHVDVSDLDEEQIKSLGSIYSIIEPLIFRWEGHSRDVSRFAVPWYNCTEAVHSMYSSINGKSMEVRRAFEKFGKYSALNLTPITKFGTVEFRHMEVTDNVEKIMNYIEICLCIVEAAKNKIDAPQELSMHGAENFLRTVFGGRLNFLHESMDTPDILWEGVDTANAITIANVNAVSPHSPNCLGEKYVELVDKLI